MDQISDEFRPGHGSASTLSGNESKGELTMSESLLRKIKMGLGFVALAVLFAVIALRANANVTDEDTWYHIKTGEYILAHGIPTTDMYTFSVGGQKWSDHEWLWQVMLFSIYNAFGGWGIVSMQVFMVVSFFLILLLLGYRQNRVFLVTFLLLLIALVEPGRAYSRPDIASLWLVLVYTTILWLFLKRSWTPYVLFALQVFWTNSHGFFVFGPLIALIMLGCEFVKRRVPLPFDWRSVGRLTDEEYRKLRNVALVLVLACFITPDPMERVLFPIRILMDARGGAKFFYSEISELQRPVPLHQFLDFSIYPTYQLLIIFSLLGFIVNYRRIDIRIFTLWAIFLAFSWAARRNLLFFGPAAYLSLMVNLANVRLSDIPAISELWVRIRYPSIILLKLALILGMGQQFRKMTGEATYLDPDTLRLQSAYGRLSDQHFAKNAVDFLMEHRIQGNFFNYLGTGLYVVSRYHPNIKVFIDGRLEIFGAEFLKMYLKILKEGDWQLFEEQVKKYNITGVILTSTRLPIPPSFLKKVYDHPDWKLIYLDHDAVIFLKDVPENQAAIAKLGMDLSQWVTKPASPDLLKHRELAKTFHKRAVTLNDLGLPEQAKREIDEALRIDPHFSGAYSLKAQLYRKEGRDQDALVLLKKALENDDRRLGLILETALAYERVEDYDSALRLGEKMISQAPKDPRGHYVLARMFAQKGQYVESFEAFKKANELRLRKDDVFKVVDVLIKKEAYPWVLTFCDVAAIKKDQIQEMYALVQDSAGNLTTKDEMKGVTK
jgi:Tfp pilus assembly protein PilF